MVSVAEVTRNLCHCVVAYCMCVCVNDMSVMCVHVAPTLGSQGTTVQLPGAATWTLPPCGAGIRQQQGPGRAGVGLLQVRYFLWSNPMVPLHPGEGANFSPDPAAVATSLNLHKAPLSAVGGPWYTMEAD